MLIIVVCIKVCNKIKLKIVKVFTLLHTNVSLDIKNKKSSSTPTNLLYEWTTHIGGN